MGSSRGFGIFPAQKMPIYLIYVVKFSSADPTRGSDLTPFHLYFFSFVNLTFSGFCSDEMEPPSVVLIKGLFTAPYCSQLRIYAGVLLLTSQLRKVDLLSIFQSKKSGLLLVESRGVTSSKKHPPTFFSEDPNTCYPVEKGRGTFFVAIMDLKNQREQMALIQHIQNCPAFT